MTEFLPEPGEYNLRGLALRCRPSHIVCHVLSPRVAPTPQIIPDSRRIVVCALHNHPSWPQRSQLVEEEWTNVVTDVPRLRGPSRKEHDDWCTAAVDEFVAGRCYRGIGEFRLVKRFECILKYGDW